MAKDLILGRHHVVEFYGCDLDIINNKAFIRESMIEAAKRAKATIVADVFHEFNPHGISGVVVIAESHLAIHSWPEYGCVSVDLFTCSDTMDAKEAVKYLSNVFKAQSVDEKILIRGNMKGGTP